MKDMFEHLALDPDVFLPSESGSHHDSDAAVRDLQRLVHPGMAMLDLCNGKWQEVLCEPGQTSKTGQEFLRAMHMRLLRVETQRKIHEPEQEDWYQEAVAVKDHEPSLSISAYVQALPFEGVGGSLPRTVASKAWAHIKRRQHTQLARSVEGYKALMTSVAWRSRIIEVIDPYMDPNKPGYRDIVTALGEAAKTTSRLDPMQVNFHCRCATNYRNRTDQTDRIEYWEHAMRKNWGRVLAEKNIKGVAVIWRLFPPKDPHDRFVLTKHFMLRCTNSFDTGKAETMGIQFEDFDAVDGAPPHKTLDEAHKQYNWKASDNRERLLGFFEFGAAH